MDIKLTLWMIIFNELMKFQLFEILTIENSTL